MSTGLHLNLLHRDGGCRQHLLRQTRFRFSFVFLKPGYLFVWGAQGFQQAQHTIALHGILLHQIDQRLAQGRQAERPVEKQKNFVRLAALAHIVDQDQHGKGGIHQRSKSLQEGGNGIIFTPGAYPLEHLNLVLAAQRTLGPMRFGRHQPQQRIQVETAEGADMRAQAQIALFQQGARGQG